MNLERGVWVLPEHKTAKKTGQPRMVYLTPPMVALTKKLLARNPAGPLFRTYRGNHPYDNNTWRCRFRRLRERLPQMPYFTAYSFRHTYATQALENGVEIAHVATLLGHASTDMVMRHYQHLSQRIDHMRKAAAKATGEA